MKKTEWSVLLGLVLAMALTALTDTNHRARAIRADTLRLHVIANSDSPRDTEIKLAVKDRIAALCGELLCRAENSRQAARIAAENTEYLQQAADSLLGQCGAGYTARCTVEDFYFDTTAYEDFTLPAGSYTALTVRLGKAEGTNWWCVAYPALCISPRAEYEDDASNTFIETDSFRLKFKVVELTQQLKRLFDTPTPAYTHIAENGED